MWYVIDKQNKQTIYKDKDKKTVIMEGLKYERGTGRKTEIHKEKVNHCIFSQNGYCAAWEGPGMSKRCNGHKAPQGCPANK